MPEARNTIYLSFGSGPDGGLSLGLYYERMISPNACLRFGINYFQKEYYQKILLLPITINYLTSKNNKFEVGLGGGPALYKSGGKSGITLTPAGSIGYRYQLESKSPVFKLGLEMPAFGLFNLLGAGYHF